MGASSRRKGITGEREVAALWRRAGFEVRGLEGEGDHLIVCADGLTIHSEVKRQERLQLWSWIAQADAEAPAGAVAVVTFRRNRSEWRADLPLADLITLASS